MGIIRGNYLTAGVLIESSVFGVFVVFVDSPSSYPSPSGHAKIVFLGEYLLNLIRFILGKASLLKVSA